jgi:predicted extracellular nuclease
MSVFRRPCGARFALLASVSLVVAGSQLLALPAAQANPAGTGLVIREVYGGGGNSAATYNADFVELFNPTDNPVTLNGMGLQYRSAAGGSGGVAALSGTAQPHQPFLVQMLAAGTTGAALPTPNLVSPTNINMAAGNGQVLLLPTTTPFVGSGNLAGNAGIVDMVGYGGTATSFEGATAPTVPNNASSVTRSATGADTDSNSADFTVISPPTPQAGVTGLSLAAVADQTGSVGTATSLSLTASGGVPPYTFSATGLPDGLSINAGNGVISGTPTTAGTSSVTATVQDSSGPPQASDSKTFTWTINSGVTITPIRDIQGTGDSTPLAGQTVTTQGVVTARYPAPSGLNGFYIQTPGPDTANASDAVFVFGGASLTNYPALGASVQVTGTPQEFNGLTELNSANANISVIPDLPGTVTPKSQIPDTNCAVGTCPTTAAALNSDREASEGELFQPTAPWTATDVYDGGPAYNDLTNQTSNFGEIGLAADSSTPLIAPTEFIDAQATAQVQARVQWNNAHRIILDDGSSRNYTSTSRDEPAPWQSPSYAPRVGSAVSFPAPVVLTWGFNQWRIEPTTMVTGVPTATQPQFSDTRTPNATPQNVGGDLRLATFNVLNFFPTTGEEFAAQPGNSCTYFNDRAGNHITVNNCTPNGPRGAANPENLARQRDKIVAAINTADADIVSLEELENSVQFGKSRDFAITQLVDALNVGSPGKWAFAPSPAAADLPPLAEQDVIRTGFVYQPARVALVGASNVLVGSAPFGNAREPLAQAFKKAGNQDSSAFAVIVNHFKSKGSGVDDGTGQGLANPDRIAQADALAAFANQFMADRGLSKTFLVGDFNAYSHEDPIEHLEAAGYTAIDSTSDPEEETYNFDGQVGSLDHVLANAAALADVSGADVWPINGYESVYYEYSRYNYNATNLYDAGPFRSSDHSPEIVGIQAPDAEPSTHTIQILGTNDFHGRLQRDAAGPTAGAAVLAGAAKQLRAANPDTVFAAAGDLIGASTFESFIAHDKPTIDALNEAGLEVSAVGNHELDQGYNDLVNRVMAPYDASTNPYGGANWQYIAANLRRNSDDGHAVAPTWTKMFGSVKVGFVGAVTEHLPELVSPAGISQIHVTDIVAEVNAAADDLKANGADVIVVLVHEGAAGTNCATMDDDSTSDFGSIISGVDDNVDAIVSGHTHLAYNCSFPVSDWIAQGRPVTDRPVVSAGQYGMALNQLVFTVDTASGQVQAKTQALLNLQSCTSNCTPPATPVWSPNYPADSTVATIVSNAVSQAAVLGAQPLGQLGGPFFRGKLADGTTENRGAESTLGNLVADVQRWATRNPESGSAQIAFMNPGGLRQDLIGSGALTDPYPKTLTYQQAAVVQPFANTLVNEDLTGAQIKTVLEQQWQPAGASRPFLKLGISSGFTYTFDDTRPAGSRITGMWLNGTPIVSGQTYSVTVNSFLASGGDSFTELNNGLNKQDTGQTDLAAMVAYMATFGSGGATVSPNYSQNGVGISFPAGAPASYKPGDHVRFTVTSWSMTNARDTKDASVHVSAGPNVQADYPLDNTAQSALPGFDIAGRASVDLVLPADTTPQVLTFTLTGAATGSTSRTSVQVVLGTSGVSAGDVGIEYGQDAQVPVTVSGTGAVPTGAVQILDGATSIAMASLDATGRAQVTIPARTFGLGAKALTVAYSGDSTHQGSQGTMTLTTAKATPTVVAPDVAIPPGGQGTATVSVTAAGVTPTGTATFTTPTATLGTASLVGGTASFALPDLPNATVVTATYSGDAVVNSGSDTFTVTKNVKATPTLTVDDVTVEYGKAAPVTVRVTAPGVTPTGTVKVSVGGTVLGSGKLSGGVATVTLPARSLPVGSSTLMVEYSGDSKVNAAVTTFQATVTKAASTTTATLKPKNPKAGTKVSLDIKVTGPTGVPVAGTVQVSIQGTTTTVLLNNGVASVDLGSFVRGTYTASLSYSGSDTLLGSSTSVTFTVT